MKFAMVVMILVMQIAYAQEDTTLYRGGKEGGGGDPSEERVNVIRADILSWIKRGGAKGLSFPAGVTFEEYNSKMSKLLVPKVVVITFVEKDDPKEVELQVVVDGKPKTCRSFISDRSLKPNILCSIKRFTETSEAGQYQLIHHEYAGLAYLEKNEGSASDYEISSQITDYLVETSVLKLAIKRNESIEPNQEKSYFQLLGDMFREGEKPLLSNTLNKFFPGRCFDDVFPDKALNAGFFMRESIIDAGPLGPTKKTYEGSHLSISKEDDKYAFASSDFLDDKSLEYVTKIIEDQIKNPRGKLTPYIYLHNSKQSDVLADITMTPNSFHEYSTHDNQIIATEFKTSGKYLISEGSISTLNSWGLKSKKVLSRCYFFNPETN